MLEPQEKQRDSRTSLEAPCASHESLAQSWTDSHRSHSTLISYRDIIFCGNAHSHLNCFFSFKMQRPLLMLLSPSQFGKNTLWRIHPLILQYIEHTTFYSILLCFWEKSSSCLQLIKVIQKLFRNFLCFLLYVLLASSKMWPAAEDITRWLNSCHAHDKSFPEKMKKENTSIFTLNCELQSFDIPLCNGFKRITGNLAAPRWTSDHPSIS